MLPLLELLAFAVAIAALVLLTRRRRTTRTALAEAAWRDQFARQCAEARESHVLDLADVPLPQLPDDLGAACRDVQSIRLRVARSMVGLAALARLPRLRTVTLLGSALHRTALRDLEALPHVETLDLRGCQAAVDPKSASGSEYCVPADLYALSAARRIPRLLLPLSCALEVCQRMYWPH